MRNVLWLAVALWSGVCITSVSCSDDAQTQNEPHSVDAGGGTDTSEWDDTDTGEGDTDPVCVLDETCAGQCGFVVDACNQEVQCGPCREEDGVERLMVPVHELIDLIVNESYMVDILGLDVDEIRQEAADAIRFTPNGDVGQMLALTQSTHAFRNGHSGIFNTTRSCRDLGGADKSMTAYGVCAKPYKDHYVVTHMTRQANPLGLSPGDEILGFNDHFGAAMTQEVLSRPLCGSSAANDIVAQEHAAESLFSVATEGDTLHVRSPNGSERTVRVTAPLSSYDLCRFPAGAVAEPFVEARLRDDGIAVIKLHRMILFEGEEGWIRVISDAQNETFINNMIEQVKTEFDRVHDNATGIVWDIRGNIGGSSPLSFAIVGGMPGVRRAPLARCTTRRANSDPVVYDAFGPDYDLVRDERFETTKPTAVLIDGLAVSAADYFALAVSLGTDAMMFGRPTAGGYGSGLGYTLTTDENWFVAYDPFRCNDIDGEPLETRSVQPDVFVEYEPEDLANGSDTVLETAAEWIHTQ